MNANRLHVSVNVFGLLGLAALLSGCATSKPRLSLDPVLTTYSADALAKGPVALPANYNTENFRRLQLGVAFEVLPGASKGGKALMIDPALSARLQTEMAKLRRFTVFSAHNRDGVTFFKALADVDGDVKLKEADAVRDIDLVLSAKLIVSKEVHERAADTLLIYEVECDFSCEDIKTRTVKFAEKAKGRTARSKIFSMTGRQLAGFDDSKGERQAITQAALKALAVVANKLGNTYPVGGAVTGATATGNRLQLDKGFDDGIMKNQAVVAFVKDGGVDVPLCLLEAVPSTDTSSMTVKKWNTGDPDAKPLVKAFQADPKGFLQKSKVYGVGYGLAVPPEWENAYGDSMDEAMRARQ